MFLALLFFTGTMTSGQCVSSIPAELNAEGLKYHESGQSSGAVMCLEKAANISPESHVTLLNLGVIYFRTKELGRAVSMFIAASKIAPLDGEIYNWLDVTYLKEEQNGVRPALLAIQVLESRIDKVAG